MFESVSALLLKHDRLLHLVVDLRVFEKLHVLSKCTQQPRTQNNVLKTPRNNLLILLSVCKMLNHEVMGQ